ncbi:hypothetical protein CVM73_17160 [Bradyrhizobium forestalis]|uniref:Uncharacterized protein n=1 Tax=Bradyrhizobium forestalis TaxID=1419263 RepID=A0A2M8R8H4_9BRAD|nr:hypothetical protein [Bradyrhizobium forestalis]PJG54135.1 hypothetical protein CVM73_17160 [Bradyrhizobium forestalis]
MIERILIVDGMLSGTGIRDGSAGGYLDPSRIGISRDLAKRISKWVADYENAHYYQFSDTAKNEELDEEGIAIAQQLQRESPDTRVEYFSNAKMLKIAI